MSSGSPEPGQARLALSCRLPTFERLSRIAASMTMIESGRVRVVKKMSSFGKTILKTGAAERRALSPGLPMI
jgi:hypothetical protein